MSGLPPVELRGRPRYNRRHVADDHPRRCRSSTRRRAGRAVREGHTRADRREVAVHLQSARSGRGPTRRSAEALAYPRRRRPAAGLVAQARSRPLRAQLKASSSTADAPPSRGRSAGVAPRPGARRGAPRRSSDVPPLTVRTGTDDTPAPASSTPRPPRAAPDTGGLDRWR